MPVDLNDFFKSYQNLYNGNITGCKKLIIKPTKNSEEFLGYFNYKIFTKEELGVLIPPNNLQDPYSLCDILYDEEDSNNNIFTKKPPNK